MNEQSTTLESMNIRGADAKGFFIYNTGNPERMRN